MFDYIEAGRLPISPRNMKMVPHDEDISVKEIINKRSSNSDLTIIGFRGELVKKQKLDIFEGYDNLGNILFVNSINKKILNKRIVFSYLLYPKILILGTKNHTLQQRQDLKKEQVAKMFDAIAGDTTS